MSPRRTRQRTRDLDPPGLGSMAHQFQDLRLGDDSPSDRKRKPSKHQPDDPPPLADPSPTDIVMTSPPPPSTESPVAIFEHMGKPTSTAFVSTELSKSTETSTAKSRRGKKTTTSSSPTSTKSHSSSGVRKSRSRASKPTLLDLPREDTPADDRDVEGKTDGPAQKTTRKPRKRVDTVVDSGKKGKSGGSKQTRAKRSRKDGSGGGEIGDRRPQKDEKEDADEDDDHDEKEDSESDGEGRTIVDPLRASLTWHEDEITVYDPDDEDDDGEGLNGVAFQAPPAVARRLQQRRRQQIKAYQQLVEREQRELRSLRRRQRNAHTTCSSSSASSVRDPKRWQEALDQTRLAEQKQLQQLQQLQQQQQQQQHASTMDSPSMGTSSVAAATIASGLTSEDGMTIVSSEDITPSALDSSAEPMDEGDGEATPASPGRHVRFDEAPPVTIATI